MQNPLPMLSATAVAFALSVAAPASGQAAFQYAVGSGEARSDLVVDFAGSGSTPGAAYAFSYFYDPADAPTGLDLLTAIDAGGDLDVATTQFSFGVGIDGFTFGDDSRVFESFSEGSFRYFVSGGTGQQFLAPDFTPTLRDYADDGYTVAASGASGRFLADGSVDAFRFADAAGTEPAAVPANIPEPATAVLVVGGGLLLLRRRSS